MPLDSDAYCNPDTFREFITNCKMHMGWWNYFGAGLFGLILVAITLLIVVFGGFLLFYVIPLWIGNEWNNRLLRKKGKRVYYYDFAEFANFDIKFYLYGWLIIIIILCCVGMAATALYWLGHLFVLGQ